MEKEQIKTTKTAEIVEENTNAQLPTEQPMPIVQNDVRLYGRKIIYADYEPEEMNEQTITKILNDIFSIHLHNSYEINYLENYYKGFQPILDKVKEVRPTINNKVIENNAYYMVEFKKGFVFGKPMQYVQLGDVANEEVGELNSYMQAVDKYSKDMDLAEDLYTSGIGHRLVLPNISEDGPFLIENLDSKTTFIVYSSSVLHKKLFACTYTKGVNNSTIKGSIYTNNAFYSFTTASPFTAFEVKLVKGHILGDIPIFEYYLNKSRMGIIEVVMDILNAINRITSDELDGLEQFVQSLLVFINQDVDQKDLEAMLKLGAVKMFSPEPGKNADLKLISNEIDHSNTKILHERLFNTALNIVGIPKNSDKASGGDTGQARYLGEGWTMADARADGDETKFKQCAKPELKLILLICRLAPTSKINTLTLRDVDQKLPRNKSDNFLVKAQGLMNQIQSGISPDVAMTTSGLYSDPNETFNKSMSFYGGSENWVRLFIEKTNKQIQDNKNNEEKPEDGEASTIEDSKSKV
ncbi:MAG: phage portal protein [Firmicutes bacterium]|nr:phage portal protein [Bacillota bacterium]